MKPTFFTENQKTILSVDFDRYSTCGQICPYCYVDNMEKIYPNYLEKIKKNVEESNKNPENFTNKLNEGYLWYRKSKSKKYERLDKLPVRIYGSGDYVFKHFEFLSKLTFKFFIISKNLTNKVYSGELNKLLALPNCQSVVLSYDKDNLKNYENHENTKVKYAYTGLPEEMPKLTNYKFDTFFNISDKKIDKLAAQKIKFSCPADSGVMKLQKACSYCNRCWR